MMDNASLSRDVLPLAVASNAVRMGVVEHVEAVRRV